MNPEAADFDTAAAQAPWRSVGRRRRHPTALGRRAQSIVSAFAIVLLAAAATQCSRKPEAAKPRTEPATDVNKSIAERGATAAALLDTNVRSAAAYGADALAAKTGWTLLPEDITKHEFKGDAAIVNDRLVAVIRANGDGIETYCVTPKGLAPRATLRLEAQADEAAGRLVGVSIVENTVAAAEVTVIFGTSGGHKMIANMRLTQGSCVLELTPGAGTSSVGVKTAARGIIVPDYFSDDLCCLPERMTKTGKALLPAENFFLALLGDGKADAAMMMCVSETAGREPEATFASGGVTGWRMPCVSGKKNRIWFAFLETPALWSVEDVHAAQPLEKMALSWRPPFPARWRADIVSRQTSLNLVERERADACCWAEAEGVALRGPFAPSEGPILFYPIDRTKDTPIDVKLPVDIMRETLGVGPCAYILALEGGGEPESPTPADVMKFVERKFEQKQAGAAKADIEKRLAKMVEHDGRVRERMQAYRTTIRELSEQAPEAVLGRPPSGLGAELTDYWRRHEDAMKTPERVAELSAKVIALIPNPDGAAACREIGDELRSIGEAEDAVVSKCRMTARCIRALCRAADASGPDRAFAQAALRKIEPLLQGR